MVQIVNKPGFGELLGQNLGAGLGTGLQQLAQLRMQHLAQRQQQNQLGQGLQSLFGPEKASELANLPPELLKPLISEHAKSQIRVPQTAPGLKQIMPELTDQEAEKIGSLTPALQTLIYRNYLDTPQELRGGALDQLTGSIGQKTPIVSPQVAQPLIQGAPKELKAPAKTKEERIAEHQAKKAALQPQTTIQPVKPKSVAQLVKQEGMTVKEAKEAIKEERKAEQIASKENLKFYQDTLKAEQGAKNNDKRLDRMSQLIEKGSLPNSTTYRLFKALGDNPIKVPVPILGPIVETVLNTLSKAAGGLGSAVQRGITATDTEEFEKLTQDFTRDAKDIYGSRITNYDLEQFLQMIPTLMQTDNGKKAVIRNMKNFNEATRIKSKVMKEIIKENGGKRPANLEILVDERAAPYLDASAKRFVEGNAALQPQQVNANAPIPLPFQQVLGGIEV